MRPKLRVSNTPKTPGAFDVQDPPLYDAVEGLVLRGVSYSGVVMRQLCGRRAGNHPGILTYHRIAPHIPELPKPTHNVTPATFRAQLSGLVRRGFTPWPLQQLLEYHRAEREIPPRTFVVTFDDGFETVYSRAWPVLRELNIPATLFVTTAYIDTDQPFPFDEWGVAYSCHSPSESYRPLTLTQCREMVESGVITIGAHTHTHQDFRGRDREFQDDVTASVEFVREQFGINDVSFAFPFGSPQRGFADSALVEAARQAGIACGVTTDPVLIGADSDPFAWGRFNAFAWDTAATLAAKLDGWYSWAPRLKRRVQGTINNVLASATR